MPREVRESFHESMQGRVIDGGDLSDPFTVCNGTKQGCILDALLFSIFFTMLLVAFNDCDLGVPVQFRIDGSACLQPAQASSSHKDIYDCSQGTYLRWWLCTRCSLARPCPTVVRSLHCHCSAIRAHGQPQKDGSQSRKPASQSSPAQPVITAGDATINSVNII